MDGLWVRSAWKFPWRRAQPLHLSVQKPESESLKRTGEICGLSDMYRLPRELLDMIQCDSRRSLFWRCISAVQLASRVTRTTPKPLISFQLGQVLSWKRNEYPEYITSKTELPIIRLTIDSDGISRVERLSCAPVYSGECNNHYRPIVEHVSQVAKIQVQLKDCLMRLILPDGQPAPAIWNTPAPPDLAYCKAYGSEPVSRHHIREFFGSDSFSWQHFHAVEANKIRGITFYFLRGKFSGIYIHYEEEPSAMDDEYDRFINRREEKSVWIHLPIPKNDRLLALDVRQGRRLMSLNILVRTKLVGDIIIGQRVVDPYTDLCLSSSSAPETVVYGVPPGTNPVTFFGTYYKPPYQAHPPKMFPLEKCYSSTFASGPRDMFHTWASLEDVSSTLTFNDPNTGICKGIMFQYRNGGCRTVGQCRWHVDSTIRVEHPRVFQFKREVRALNMARVAFQHSEDEQAQEGWECHLLKGFVTFWFTDGWSYLAINADKAHPDMDMRPMCADQSLHLKI
ncbi:hypothetical protein NW768_004107 [Fusarium equiseti]|uniref:F-box domain-containing protein n=1 Tax=Fusarium equiseti TaxID=61235 RepID=A0ABQ8RJH6_FUSEQ|nr:hypothetical protein NW768_004107 [Fusarium equiseti]